MGHMKEHNPLFPLQGEPLVKGTQSIPPLTRGGQEGLMNICLEMLRIMKKQAPIVFWDFEIDAEKKIAFKKDECA